MRLLRFPPAILSFLLAALWMSGCGLLGGGEEPSERTLENDGRACLSNQNDDGNDDRLAAGSTNIRVRFRSCLGCGDEVKESECSYEVDGDRIVVESRLVIRSKPTRGACPSVCEDAPQTTSCEGPELDEGDYELVHGDATTEFTVPREASDERACAGRGL